MMKKGWMIRRALSLLLVLLLLSAAAPSVHAAQTRPVLTVGGVPFGVRFLTGGVLVVGYSDVETGNGCHNPARQAGLKPGDCMTHIDGEELTSTDTLSRVLQERGGAEHLLRYQRDGEEREAKLRALCCEQDGKWRVGLLVRDSGAGIGTITFIGEDGSFAGLGHGICDGDSGALIPISRGAVMGVTIGGVVRGAPGAPGELRGHFSAGKTGALLGNTVCGVYGMLDSVPECAAGRHEIAYRNEVHDGSASVWCTLDDNVSREYSVTLSHIRRGEQGNKCFTVKVTDAALLERTGGIVQGMSGSPIIQDGRLVGALTHVLIGDPTTGYGIFVENMLANIPAALG